MRYHRGPPIQHGAGLGSIFSGLWRTLVPVAKSAVKTIGNIATSPGAKSLGKVIKNQVKQAAVETALDALDGKSAGSSAKNRLKSATRNILHATQYTEPTRKRSDRGKGKRPRVKAKRRRIRRRQEPLFDDYYDREDDDDY